MFPQVLQIGWVMCFLLLAVFQKFCSGGVVVVGFGLCWSFLVEFVPFFEAGALVRQVAMVPVGLWCEPLSLVSSGGGFPVVSGGLVCVC